jgi:DNA-binding protein H-NS
LASEAKGRGFDPRQPRQIQKALLNQGDSILDFEIATHNC